MSSSVARCVVGSAQLPSIAKIAECLTCTGAGYYSTRVKLFDAEVYSLSSDSILESMSIVDL